MQHLLEKVGNIFQNSSLVPICFKLFQQCLIFDLTVLTTWLKYKKVVLCSYALTKKERSIKNSFQDFKVLLDHLKCGIGLSCNFEL